MRIRSRLLLTALTAALVLAAAISLASARRFQLSNQGIRATWRALTFHGTDFIGGNHDVICPLTIEGTFHSRTISKVSGQLIGYITSARLTSAQCTFNGVESFAILNGTEGSPSTLPWHIRYDSFAGTLPNISFIRLQLIGVGFRLITAGVRCLYKTTVNRPWAMQALVNAESLSGGIRMLEGAANRIPLFEGEFGCSEEVEVRGVSDPIVLLGTTTVINIHLVQ